MKPSKESIEADSKISVWKDVKIFHGENREGIPWTIVSVERFAEFRCGKIVVEFIPSEDAQNIAGMMPFVDTSDIRKLIEDVIYSPT